MSSRFCFVTPSLPGSPRSFLPHAHEQRENPRQRARAAVQHDADEHQDEQRTAHEVEGRQVDEARAQVQHEEDQHQQDDDVHRHHVVGVLQREIHPPHKEQKEAREEKEGERKQAVLRGGQLAVRVHCFVLSRKTDQTRTVVASIVERGKRRYEIART